MVPSPLHPRSLPAPWQAALLGTLASLPATVILNRLPDSEATLGGSIMIVGAFVAGAVAAGRATDPGAAGLRAGAIGGAVALAVFVVTEAGAALGGRGGPWPPSRLAFFGLAAAVILCLAPVFGLVCGRVGGWVANRVGSLSGTDTSAS